MAQARSLLERGRILLKNAGVEDFSFDCRCLLEHFCKISQDALLLNGDITVENEAEKQFLQACKRRAAGEPLQYILGKWEFMGLEFTVNENVLIPRADTETLVEYILKNHAGAPRVLDLCCGSGCIGISVKRLMPTASVTLADKSDAALKVAALNAKELGADVSVLCVDVMQGGAAYFEKDSFDIIVCNPPYIKTGDIKSLPRELGFEPRLALDGGADGADFYRALAESWAFPLSENGELIVETGFDTWDIAARIFESYGWRDIKTARDFGNIVRLVAAKKE